VVTDDPSDQKGALKAIGGSLSDNWNNVLANQAVHALWLGHSDQEARERQYNATVAALIGIGPRDELEGMLAAQLLASSRRRWASFSTPRSSRCSNSPTMFGPPSRSHSPMSCSTELTAISKQLCYDRRMTVSRLDIGRGPPNHDEALRAAPYSR